MVNGYGKKELKNAQRTEVFVKILEYATSMKKQMEEKKYERSSQKNRPSTRMVENYV